MSNFGAGLYLPVYLRSYEVLTGVRTGGTFNSQRTRFERIKPARNVDATSAPDLPQVNPGPQREGELIISILTGLVC